MPILPIITGTSTTILRQKARRGPRVTKAIRTLLSDMEATMHAMEGIGLAAPQIGQSLRLCLATIDRKISAFINPDIVWKSTERETAEEGCLSLPGVYLPVPRAQAIAVRFLDRGGKERERRYDGLSARILQHEVDHLDGILIVDYAKLPPA